MGQGWEPKSQIGEWADFQSSLAPSGWGSEGLLLYVAYGYTAEEIHQNTAPVSS